MSPREEYTSVPLTESEHGEVLDAFIPTVPVATARPLMEVIAPATLKEGFEFYVTVGPNNQTVKVQVPLGGVEKGQSFQVPFPEKAHPALPTGVPIPVGNWRDGLFHCFEHGICHPHLWASLCCPLIATVQVIHRMQFDWTGQVTNSQHRKEAAFTIICIIAGVSLIIQLSLKLCIALLAPDQNGSTHLRSYYLDRDDVPVSAVVCVVLYNAWSMCNLLGVLLLLSSTRRSVRKRYAIPTSHDCVDCGACGDCACMCFCQCCAVAQMLRHTTDYNVYPSYCLSPSGTSPFAPAIV